MIETNAIGIVHTLTGTHTFVKESLPAKIHDYNKE